MIIRFLVSALSLGVATWLLPGIWLDYSGKFAGAAVTMLIVAAIFGLVNALIKPLFVFVTSPLLLITLGLFTRPAAFIAAGQMAVAFFTQHFPSGFWPIENKGELAVLFCWGFFLLVFAGSGWLAVDSVLGRRKRDVPVVDTAART